MADLLNLLTDADHGGAASEANRKLEELLSAIYATRKPGSIKIEIAITPSKFSKFDGSITGVNARIKTDIKKPEFDSPDSLFFVFPDGSLSRKHPDQVEMEFVEEQERNARG